VVNTHWHWDHVFGNARFPGAEIWGHARCREALVERPDEMKAGALEWMTEWQAEIEEVEVVPPSQTFEDRVGVDIGRAVELSFHGKGHTDADIRIAAVGAGIVFLGDLVEEGAPPSFGDSHPLEWPSTLERAMEGVYGTVVPGHGDVVDRAFVDGQQAELEEVAGLAIRCIESEMTLAEACGMGPYSPEVMRSALGRALEVAGLSVE
jgi:glyoxylase-like metal-dependent hydrolase (beta-lactamase superfamily II)